MDTVNLFGDFFKGKRLALKKSLRQFCQENGFDPGNLSKLERGILKPPGEKDLEKYAAALSIKKGSDAWNTFFEYADISRGEIPKEVLADDEIVKKLPLFFRTLKGEKVKKEKLAELIKLIKGS